MADNERSGSEERDELAALREELSAVRAELDRLRQRDALLSAAIEASPAGILIAGVTSMRVEVSNSAAARIFGDDDLKLTSKKAWRAFHPDGSPHTMETLPLSRAMRQGETTDGELVILERADGSRLWTEAHAAPIRDVDGNIVAGCVVVTDVTQRTEAERMAERFRLIVEATPDFVGMVNPEGETVYVNPGGIALCGYPPGTDLRGKPIAFYHSPAVAQRVLDEGLPAALEHGSWLSETTVLTRSGEEIPVSQVLMTHRDREGRLIYLSTVLRDLREIRKLEAQLLHSQKLEALGRLAGGIAHDFNNMLFVINNYVAMVMEGLPDERSREDLKLALDAAERATTLCSQLLGFARKQVISPRVVCVNELLREFERFIRQVIGENIELRVTLAPDLWNVRIDPAQFDQIVTNLSVNARDAQPDGGMLIIETENAVLDEAYVTSLPDVRAGRYVLIAISDRGMGMSPSVMEHAFEPFFSTKPVGKGTGLGLATVHGAVKQNGGHVGVYSEIDRGTTIKVYLPAVDEAAPVVDSSPPVEVSARETVLVVEDEPLVRDLTVRLLASAGFTVLQAPSGEQALLVASEFDGDIHLLVSDVVMPKMSGPALADELVRTRPTMKVLFVSGYTDQAIVHHGVLAQGVEFLAKPFGRDKLLGRVRKILGRKEA